MTMPPDDLDDLFGPTPRPETPPVPTTAPAVMGEDFAEDYSWTPQSSVQDLPLRDQDYGQSYGAESLPQSFQQSMPQSGPQSGRPSGPESGEPTKSSKVRPRRRTKTSEPRPESKEPVAGQRPRAANVVVRLVPPSTDFDFLEGAYQTIRQTRLILIGVAGGVAALLLVLAGIGANAGNAASGTAASANTLQLHAANTRNEYDLKSRYNLVPLSQMQTDDSARLPVAKAVISGSVDVTQIIAGVEGLAGPGIQVTNVNITQGGATTATPAPNVSGAPSANPALPTYNVTATIVAQNPQIAAGLISATKNLTYLSNVTTTPSGTPTSVVVSLAATVNMTSSSAAPVAAALTLPPALAALTTTATTIPTVATTTTNAKG